MRKSKKKFLKKVKWKNNFKMIISTHPVNAKIRKLKTQWIITPNEKTK